MPTGERRELGMPRCGRACPGGVRKTTQAGWMEAQTSVDFSGKLGLRRWEGPLGIRRKQVAETCNLGLDASSPGFSDVESRVCWPL